MSHIIHGRSLKLGAIAAILFTLCGQSFAETGLDGSGQAGEEIRLWPGAAPGTGHWTGEEITRDHEVPAGKIIVKTNVTVPTLTPFRPTPGKANGTAMLVLPGGGFRALAWDLEGTEIARWLVDRGITAFVLKYRVGPSPLPPGAEPPADLEERLRMLEPAWRIAVADAGQAVRLLRAKADEFGIDPERIGMIGFSAGAATTLGAVFTIDPAARPDFAVSLYGRLMDDAPVPADAPPLFVVATQADATVPASSSTQMFDRWSEAGRPAELHVYTEGEHGFGMRPKGLPVDHWPAAFEAWLSSLSLMSRAEPNVPPTTPDG